MLLTRAFAVRSLALWIELWREYRKSHPGGHSDILSYLSPNDRSGNFITDGISALWVIFFHIR